MKYRTMPPATIRTMHPHSLTLAGSLTFLFPLSVACPDPLKLESEGHGFPHGTIVLHVRDITLAGNGPRFQSHKMDDCRKRSLEPESGVKMTAFRVGGASPCGFSPACHWPSPVASRWEEHT